MRELDYDMVEKQLLNNVDVFVDNMKLYGYKSLNELRSVDNQFDLASLLDMDDELFFYLNEEELKDYVNFVVDLYLHKVLDKDEDKDEDEVWLDPAGGSHSSYDDDPALSYV